MNTPSRFDELKVKIQKLRAELIQSYTDKTVPYEEIIELSQELDMLIIEYHRLLAEYHKKVFYNGNNGKV